MEPLAAPPVPKRRRAVSCRYHCSESGGGCGRHFSSEDAFVAHRVPDGPGQRRCAAPETIGKLVAKSEDGRCDIGHSHRVSGVTVWQTLAAAQAGGWD